VWFLELNDSGRRIQIAEIHRTLQPELGTDMKSELADEMYELIEARSGTKPTSMEFEMAYQARVAIDRIRFAIRHTEKFASGIDQLRDVGLQLLDALERLEAVDRRFQVRSVSGTEAGRGNNSRQRLTNVNLRPMDVFERHRLLNAAANEGNAICTRST
jgi:hypothetical protein